MTVTKSTRECYEIRPAKHPGEWATITIAQWQAKRDPRGTNYGGEIVINSTFGTWGNTWSACAVPFKQFLIGLDFDYIFTTFMGHRLNQFDAEASWDAILKRIIRQRREGHLDKAEAREAWATVIEHRDDMMNDVGFGYAMFEIAKRLDHHHPMRDHFADPMAWETHNRYDHQAVCFWNQIWPEFTAALRVEIYHPGADLTELHVNA